MFLWSWRSETADSHFIPLRVCTSAMQSIRAGWYSTGDIVHVDGDGFLHIRGRIKRFAKVAGEMISLEVVERIAASAAPAFMHAASSRADAAKGEALVLFTTDPTLKREQLSAAAKSLGLPELAVPRILKTITDIPLLGSGKTDYVQLKKMAEDSTTRDGPLAAGTQPASLA